MSENELNLVPLPGSERSEVAGMQPAAIPRSDADTVEVTIVLRRQADVPDSALSAPGNAADLAPYGAAQADVDAVTGTLGGLGLRIVAVDAASRRVRVSGTVPQLERIFGTTLGAAPAPASGPPSTAVHRVRSGGLSIPAELDGIVTAVLGLDDRPQSRALYRTASTAAVSASFTPLQLGAIYDFPPGTDGTGQTVAIIELGGGFAQTDLDAYFSGLGVASPTVTAVGVDGATNVPGQDPNGADGEVLLDIEVVGALAPGADIVVYFAPNTDAGFLDAVAQAAHATPAPVAISISWGQSEDQWTAQARKAMDDAFVDAAALGVTVTVAAGDDGSTDRETDGGVHVDFPAASPHVLACGGTSLTAQGTTVSAEKVWNNGAGQGATGGGVSTTFARPAWQSGVDVPTPPGGSAGGSAADSTSGGRGVPDVAGDADPATGYEVLIDGQRSVIGGTSAVAPLWAALIARLAQAGGSRFGLIAPRLYAGATQTATAPGFRDITAGTNGAYSAGPGWDACTGLGVPIGTDLATALSRPVSG